VKLVLEIFEDPRIVINFMGQELASDDRGLAILLGALGRSSLGLLGRRVVQNSEGFVLQLGEHVVGNNLQVMGFDRRRIIELRRRVGRQGVVPALSHLFHEPLLEVRLLRCRSGLSLLRSRIVFEGGS